MQRVRSSIQVMELEVDTALCVTDMMMLTIFTSIGGGVDCMTASSNWMP